MGLNVEVSGPVVHDGDYAERRASVFGSYARGEAGRDSGKPVDVYENGELEEGPLRDAVLSEAVAL